MTEIIAQGSKSDLKINASEAAIRRHGISATIMHVAACSKQNEQPVGFKETLAGAIARAEGVLEICPEATRGIGIENGIFEVSDTITIDIAIVVVKNRSDGKVSIATSAGVQLPQECVAIARKRGFKTTTVGSVIAAVYGGSDADPHATLTHHVTGRISILTNTIIIALSQDPQ